MGRAGVRPAATAAAEHQTRGGGGALMVGKKPAAHEDLGEILFLNADLQFFKQ